MPNESFQIGIILSFRNMYTVSRNSKLNLEYNKSKLQQYRTLSKLSNDTTWEDRSYLSTIVQYEMWDVYLSLIFYTEIYIVCNTSYSYETSTYDFFYFSMYFLFLRTELRTLINCIAMESMYFAYCFIKYQKRSSNIYFLI